MRSSVFCLLVCSLLASIEAINIAALKTQKLTKKTETVPSDRDLLLQAVGGLNYGVKATKADNEKIESLVQALILSSGKKSIKFPADAFSLENGGKNKYQRSILSGNWELQYTNGPDVISIAKIPGVNLDYVGQRVDTESNTITNLVNASGFLADTAQEVIVEVRQVSPDKVELDFVGTFSAARLWNLSAVFIVFTVSVTAKKMIVNYFMYTKFDGKKIETGSYKLNKYCCNVRISSICSTCSCSCS